MSGPVRNPLLLGARKPPTKKHRPAVWECMLGAVYARNDAGETRYFDFDWEGAVAFAGVTAERDPRTARNQERPRSEHDPSYRQMVLYVR